MFSIPAESQLHTPPKRQKVHRQGCLGMRQGFCTHNRIKGELAEEVNHPGRQITQWRPQVNQTTLWDPRGRMDHLQHLAQEALVC